MDRPARTNEDLFEPSTMSFGEHLEELRRSLMKALLWLAIGLGIGLLFANNVVQYIQTPLQGAIRKFYADRDLSRLGYHPDAPEAQHLKRFLMERGLVFETIYLIPPDELIDSTGTEATAESNTPQPPTNADPAEPAAEPNVAEPSLAEGVAVEALASEGWDWPSLLKRLPDPSELRPHLQLRRVEQGASSLTMQEPFLIWFKAGLVVGAVLASPMIFYHIWQFVAAGLYPHERRYVYFYLPFSIGLFLSGVGLAFFFVLHYVLNFLLSFNASLNVQAEPRLSYYMSFVLLLPLGFGVAFQLPLVMLFLQRIGLIETSSYLQSWRVAVLIIAVVAMILTPAEVTSMIALAIPLTALYFLGILLCMYLPRGQGMGSRAYDPR